MGDQDAKMRKEIKKMTWPNVALSKHGFKTKIGLILKGTKP